MSHADQIEEMISIVSCMDRETLIDKFLSFQGSFPVDFTEDYLRSLSVDRLRHVFVALCLQTNQLAVAA